MVSTNDATKPTQLQKIAAMRVATKKVKKGPHTILFRLVGSTVQMARNILYVWLLASVAGAAEEGAEAGAHNLRLYDQGVEVRTVNPACIGTIWCIYTMLLPMFTCVQRTVGALKYVLGILVQSLARLKLRREEAAAKKVEQEQELCQGRFVGAAVDAKGAMVGERLIAYLALKRQNADARLARENQAFAKQYTFQPILNTQKVGTCNHASSRAMPLPLQCPCLRVVCRVSHTRRYRCPSVSSVHLS